MCFFVLSECDLIGAEDTIEEEEVVNKQVCDVRIALLCVAVGAISVGGCAKKKDKATTDDATVITMLSVIPSQISADLEVKSGSVKAKMNF